ncbi:EamA family transporter [Burkholderia pyrrocinia]|uniref:EamA family transporter n=1 Tax=Burkholderia pyrrocinia TaxID=60550 RepID=A0ABZ3BG25_BURPY
MRPSVYVLILAGVFLAAAGQVAFKVGADGRHAFAEFINAWVALGLVCYGAGTVLWIFALSKAELTVVYPFTALTFVLVFLAGIVFLGERVSYVQWGGVAMILGGLYLITAVR